MTDDETLRHSQRVQGEGGRINNQYALRGCRMNKRGGGSVSI